MGRVRTASLALVLAAVSVGATAAEELPVEAFAALPMLESVSLSPDGQHFAALLNHDDSTVLVTRTLAGDEPLQALMTTDNRQARFSWIHWVNPERLLAGIRFPSARGWTDTVETRLLAIDRKTGQAVHLGRRKPLGHDGPPTQIQDRVIDWLPEDGHHVLVAMKSDDETALGVYRVDVDTGRRTLVQSPRVDAVRWTTDLAHRVRVAVREHEAKFEIDVCDPDGEHWRTAWRYEAFSPDEVWPLGFGRDALHLYVSARRNGVEEIERVDLSDPDLKRVTVLGIEGQDVSGELLRGADGEPIGIGGSRVGESGAHLWDADARKLMKAIDEALSDRANTLLQLHGDGHHYLVHSQGNGVPGAYMIGDRSSGRLTVLGDTYPQLPDEAVAKKRPLVLTARDGTALPSYLTLPPGAAAGRLPLVLLPHGGPVSRDTLEFDPMAAFLAYRGYAVLQVNFRGSEGFGIEHRNAGLKRWGLEMQDDLTDAVGWAVKEGIADAGRVCIVGAGSLPARCRSTARHRYQAATERNGAQRAPYSASARVVGMPRRP